MSLPFISGRGNRGGSFAAGPAAAAPAATAPAVTAGENLVHWWKLDDVNDSGYTAIDGGGTATLSHNSSPSFDTDTKKFGSASWLGDGTDDYSYAEVASAFANSEGAPDFTICAWVRIPAVVHIKAVWQLANAANGTSGNSANIVWTHTSGADRFQWYMIYDKDEPYDGTDWNQAKNSATPAGSPWVVNKWYFLASTYEVGLATGQVKFYFGSEDGGGSAAENLISVGSETLTGGTAARIRPFDYLTIGSAGSTFLNAYIDDVRLYNTTLTEAQIGDVFNNGNGDQ